MGSASVWIAGSYQSDFARNYAREGLDISDMVAEAVAGTLEPAGVAAADVDAVHVGNAFGQLFTGQGQLGAMPATVEPGLWGKPAARHEAACASGGVAVLAAMADIEAGHYDCVLVIAVEQERNVPGDLGPRGTSARRRGSAARARTPSTCGRTCSASWPTSTTGATAWTTGTCTPSPSSTWPTPRPTRWPRPGPGRFGPGGFADDDTDNPVVEGRLRRTDCAQITDGVGRRPPGLRPLPSQCQAPQSQPTRTPASPAGATAPPPCRCKPSSTAARHEPYVFPHVRQVVTDAFARAGIARRRRPGRHRDPRLLLHVRVHGHRPLRHHRARARAGRPSRTASWPGTARSRSTPAAA